MAAAIPVAIKVVGVALAAKSIIEGLKEGNLLKAALGGVGAYFAFSGLGSMTGVAKAAQEGATGVLNAPAVAAGQEAGMSAVTTAGGMTAENAMTSAMNSGIGGEAGTELLTEGLAAGGGTAAAEAAGSAADYAFGAGGDAFGKAAGASLNAGADTAVSLTDPAVSEGGAGLLSEYGQQVPPPGGEGFMDRAMGFGKDALGFAKENPELLKVGGNMLSGWSQQRQREQEIERLMAERKRERRARGRSVGTADVAFKR